MKHHGNMEARTNVYIRFRSLKMVNSFLSGKKYRANWRNTFIFVIDMLNCSPQSFFFLLNCVHTQLGQKKLNKKQLKIQGTQHLSKSPV